VEEQKGNGGSQRGVEKRRFQGLNLLGCRLAIGRIGRWGGPAKLGSNYSQAGPGGGLVRQETEGMGEGARRLEWVPCAGAGVGSLVGRLLIVRINCHHGFAPIQKGGGKKTASGPGLKVGRQTFFVLPKLWGEIRGTA